MERPRPSDLRVFAAPQSREQGPPPLIPPISGGGEGSFQVGRYGVDLAAVLPVLHPEAWHDVPTKGHWSLHEMVAYLLSITGPGEVWLATWGFSSEPLKHVLRAVRDNRITKLHLLLSDRVRLQCPQAFQLLQQAMNDAEIRDRIRVRMEKTHVKMVVITNDEHSITVDTSANLTDNPRLEKYLIRTHRSAAVFNAGWMDLVMQGGKPFESE
jgi:hypothetical protein